MRDSRYLGHILQTTQNMVQIAPDQVQPIRAFRASVCEDEWRKVTFRSVESTQAGHSRGCTGTLSLLGTKQFPEHKKCAGGDQPTHPAVKYSLGTGKNKRQQLFTVAPVRLNRMATAKERVLVAWPKDPLSNNTPSSAICCGI